MIRKFETPDTQEVIRIWVKASILSHHFVGAEYWQGKADDMIKVYLPRAETYVWQDNTSSRILGFISLVNNHIAALFVEPSMQRRGIGRELLGYAKSLYRSINLNVYKENASSVEFYKRQGFSPVSEQLEPQTGHPEILMTYTRQ